MEWLRQLVDIVLHLDHHLAELTRTYGVWTYAIMFAVVFFETGVVITPFLPGDSLLFAGGALAASGAFDVHLLALLLFVAAVLGDSLNYAIGARIGPQVFRREYRYLNRRHLERTSEFYRVHGGKTIVLARFAPILRTFAPFVAGVGRMPYARFAAFNVAGGALWVGAFVYGGYFFGNLPWVKRNFSLVILAIVAISLLPVAIELVRARRQPVPPGGTE